MIKKVFGLVLGLLLALTLYAKEKEGSSKQGKVRGEIFDAKTGEPLIGATVKVQDKVIGSMTDVEGEYTLALQPGTYDIAVQYLSYEKKLFKDVTVKPKDVTVLNAKLKESTVEMNEVTVSARANERTEVAMRTRERKSATLLDGISAQQMSQLGDANAAGALKRVTGVSVQDGKYVYIRGLSDRYTRITLNGAIIPGLDPNKNTVQMDLFPSNIIESIEAQKTYSPEMPGNATGGLVDIITKDFPNTFTLHLSSSFGYNTQSSLNSDFLSYKGGNLDWAGMDDGTREIPIRVQKAVDQVKNSGIGVIGRSTFSRNELKEITNSFNKNMYPTHQKSFPDQSHKFSIGDQTKFLGNSLGYNMALSYSNKYRYYDDGHFSQYKKIDPVSWMGPLNEERGINDTKITGLVNLNYKVTNNHKIGLRLMRNQGGKKIARQREGYFGYERTYTRRTNLAFVERSLNFAQLHGKNVFPQAGKLENKWSIAYSYSIQNEPDRRFFPYMYDTANNGEIHYQLKTNETPMRYYRNMDQHNIHPKLQFELPLNIYGHNGTLHFGSSYLFKSRTATQRQFTYRTNNTGFDGDYDKWLGSVISDSNPYGIYTYMGQADNRSNSYDARTHLVAGYGKLDVPIRDKLRIIAGARLEYTDIMVENHFSEHNDSYKSGTINDLSILPSLNTIYTVDEDMKVRLGLSRTLGRPVFREVAPYSYYDYNTGTYKKGNPNLKITTVNNADLSWEYYFNSGEMISFGGFYKYFEDPIEERFDPKSRNPAVKYINSDYAYLYGFEMKFRKNLDFISFLKNLKVGGNLTLVESVVTIPDEVRDGILKNDEINDWPKTRQLLGQAPYIVNAFVNYQHPNWDLEANLGFHTAGEKLYIITQSGTPYIYEEPSPDFNFNISKKFADNYSLELGVDNILNSGFNAVHHFDEGDEYYQQYGYGRTYKFSIKYIID